MTTPLEDEIKNAQAVILQAGETIESLHQFCKRELARLDNLLLDLDISLQQISRKAEEADRAALKKLGV